MELQVHHGLTLVFQKSNFFIVVLVIRNRQLHRRAGFFIFGILKQHEKIPCFKHEDVPNVSTAD